MMDNSVEILLVEDDADTRANMCDILSLAGHHVATAGSVSEARMLADRGGTSVIILDWKLPDGSARELLPEIRQRYPRTDVIIVTGFADLDGTIAALQHGAADYIIKPVNPEALRASLQRILERRRIQHELHQEHQFADRILETAEAIVLVLDLEGRVVHVNPYLSRIAGWTLKDVQGRNWFETCLPEHERDTVREVFHRVAAGHKTRGTISGILTKAGGTRQIRWSRAVLKDERGQVTSVLAVGVDVTDLIEAQERAMQSERLVAIGQTMTMLAHESRNALQRIRASIDFLRLELETVPTAERDIRSIEQAADDLQGLLDEVRSYAAPIKLVRTACNLQTIWRSAWRQLESARAQRDATFVEETGKVDLTLSADAARLAQVFRNLFENSLAACHDPVRIEVIGGETPDRSGLEIRVRDNGPGLTADQREKLFDPFFTTKAAGTGLGMAIVQRIIEAHQGTIHVADDTREGASFVLTIPKTA
jgi:PAS domain S-box-containing protein